MTTAGTGARALLSWVSTIGQSIFVSVVAFVATPFLLRYLGASRLGVVRTLEQVSGYLALLYVGLGPAYAVPLLRAVAANDLARTGLLVRTAVRDYLRHSAALVLPAAAIGWLALPALLATSGLSRPELATSTVVLLATLAMMPLSPFRDLLECRQRGYWVNVGVMLQALVAAVLGVVLARAGLGLPGQYIAMIIASATMWGVLVLLSQREVLGRRTATETVEYARWSARWPLALTAVSSRVNLMTDALTVAIVLGPAPVAVLTITQRLVLTGTGFLNASVSASWAPLSHMLERGEIARFRERISELVLLVVGGGLSLGALLATLTEPFVSLWVGRGLFGGQLLVLATAVQATLFGFVLIFHWVIDVRGDAPRRLKVSLIGSTINIIASVLLARKMGIAGVTLGTIIGYVVTDVWYGPHLFFTHYGLKHSDLLRPLLRSVFSLILFLPIVAIVSILGRAGGWTHLIAAAFLGGLAWLCLVIGVLLSTGQRRAALKRLVDLSSFFSRGGDVQS